ncbi:MAG TPA: YggT family protein [Candidatus Binatia bacterium]|nr:YggT family protein [Candidatus Binatia bacterium]
MFVIANLLIAIANVLDYVLWAYMWILIGRVIVSWVNADYHNPIVRFLYGATEPVLVPLRRRLPLFAGSFDLSPIVAWLAIIFLQRFLVRSLYELAYTLK